MFNFNPFDLTNVIDGILSSIADFQTEEREREGKAIVVNIAAFKSG